MQFDNDKQKAYDSGNDANALDGQVIKIDRRNLVPLNDSRCKHDWYIDPDDGDAGFAEVWKCRQCPLGRLVERNV